MVHEQMIMQDLVVQDVLTISGINNSPFEDLTKLDLQHVHIKLFPANIFIFYLFLVN